MKHDCDHCVKFRPGYDKDTGTDLSDCPEWDTMTDEEVEASNRGDCPRFVTMESDWCLTGYADVEVFDDGDSRITPCRVYVRCSDGCIDINFMDRSGNPVVGVTSGMVDAQTMCDEISDFTYEVV